MLEKVLYPTDFSDVSKKALSYLKSMKNAGAKQVIILRVINDNRIDCNSKGMAMAGKEGPRFLKDVYEELLDEAFAQVKPIEKRI
jgi:hypothetical protein